MVSPVVKFENNTHLFFLPARGLGLCASAQIEARLAENTCTLADLTEGQVGKLLIRKSGKVQLLLGKVTLDVTMGTTCSFLQELVSVGLGDSRTGDMTVLGHIKHKLVCSPNFESLLDHRHR